MTDARERKRVTSRIYRTELYCEYIRGQRTRRAKDVALVKLMSHSCVRVIGDNVADERSTKIRKLLLLEFEIDGSIYIYIDRESFIANLLAGHTQMNEKIDIGIF